MSPSLTQSEEIDHALKEADTNGDRNANPQAAKKGSAARSARTAGDTGSFSAYRTAYMKDHKMDPE